MLKQQFPSGFKDNGWLLIKPVQSTNYILNPSGEIAGNFSALGGATVTRSTTYQKYGVYSYRVQTGANGDGISLTTVTLTNAIHYATVRVRGNLPNEVRFLVGTGIKQPELIQKIDDHWNLYGASFTATEASGRTEFRIIQLGNGIGDFYIDGIQLEALPYWTTYIDGSQDGCTWLGADNASISKRSGESKAGGQIVDLLDEYGFRIDRVVGAGASSIQVSIDSYATLPGGEFNSRKIQSRDFQIVGQFIADTEKDLRKNRQALRLEFESLNDQPMRIWYTHSDVVKEIAVHYAGGLEGDLAAFYGSWETIEDNQWGYREVYTENAAIQVIAPNPYWQEVGESAVELDVLDSDSGFQTVAGRIDGQWDSLGPPSASGTYFSISSIVEDGTYVYFGGNFENFDNIAAADNIVRYEKSTGTWSALSALNGPVSSMALAPNGNLYVGGQFTNAGGDANADYLAVWNGTTFAAVGVPLTGAASITDVLALVFSSNGTLYIGGDFDNWNNIANADNIVSWNGSSYSALATGLGDTVRALALNRNDVLYAGGDFLNAGGDADADYVAVWNGTAFEALSTLVANDVVRALAFDAANVLYLGGDFTSFSGTAYNYVASYNGSAFFQMGDGVGAAVYSIFVKNNDVFVGGLFASAGSITGIDGLARWNGSTWTPVDIDFPSTPTVIVHAGRSDPVLPDKYDLWAGFNQTGTGAYAGAVIANNEGSAPAYPKIIFSRSGGTIATIKTLTNERTTKELIFNYNLQNGETLVLDLRATKKGVVSLPSGVLKPNAILANSDFGSWSLLPGNNKVTSFVNHNVTLTAYMLWRDQYDGYD